MSSNRRRWTVALLVLALPAGAVLAFAADAPPAAGPAAGTWERVAPIFARACVHCHGGDWPVRGLSLDTHAATMKGATSGAVVVAGSIEQSPLVGRLRGTITPAMPFDGDPLPKAELEAIEAWILAGAPAPAPETAPAVPPAVPPDEATPPPAAPEGPPAPLRWRDVAPILKASCVRCHQRKGVRGPAPEGLRFDTWATTVGGPRVAVVPGRPEASPMLRAIAGKTRKRMPLDGPPWLAPAAVETLTRWIREGARDDAGAPAPMPVGSEVRLVGRLTAPNAVDEVPFAPTGARTEKGVAVGALVEVRARVEEKGALRAERLRLRSPSDGADDDDRRRDDRSDDGGRRGRGQDDGPGDDRRGR